jgi:hypothetical protein
MPISSISGLPDWTGSGLCRDIRDSDPHVPIICYMTAGEANKPRIPRARRLTSALRSANAFRARVQMLIESAELYGVRARAQTERAIKDELLPEGQNVGASDQRQFLRRWSYAQRRRQQRRSLSLQGARAPASSALVD